MASARRSPGQAIGDDPELREIARSRSRYASCVAARILRLERERYLILATHMDDAKVRAEPFEAVELDLSVLWADVQLPEG